MSTRGGRRKEEVGREEEGGREFDGVDVVSDGWCVAGRTKRLVFMTYVANGAKACGLVRIT